MSEVKLVQPGMRFRVTSTYEVRNPKGRMLARYHPTHPETGEPLDYAVTERNVTIVNKMIVDGVAVAGGAAEERRANRIAAGLARVRGRANTGRRPKAKKGN